MGIREHLSQIYTFFKKFRMPEIKYQEQILFLIVFGIIFFSLSTTTSDMLQNSRKAIACIIILFICEGMVKPYDIIYLRPCIGFWRVVLRIVQIYLYILLFLLFQTPADARKIMHFIDPALGNPVPKTMHTYDDNCELEWTNFLDNLDHYYLIHWINFICIAVVWRDSFLCWFWSAFTEVLEISLQHILPHFRECWWDHIIVDMLISNSPAIFIGMWLLKYFNVQLYDPLGKANAKSIKDWQIWHCHRRFGLFIAQQLTYIVAFAGGFFLINGLWIPPKNPITSLRLVVWFCIGLLTSKEVYYDLKTWNQPIRREIPISGKMRWNGVCVIIAEIVCIFKFMDGAGNIEDVPTPMYIIIPWSIVAAACGVFYLYLRFKPGRTTMYGPEDAKNEVNQTKKTE